MIRRFICWLGNLLKKDWHEWVLISEETSEYEPDNIYTQEYCKHCGAVLYNFCRVVCVKLAQFLHKNVYIFICTKLTQRRFIFHKILPGRL